MGNKRVTVLKNGGLVALLLLCAVCSSTAQVWQDLHTPYDYDHVAAKNSLIVPTGCGAPTGLGPLLNNKLRRAAFFYDTCSMKLHIFNPKDSTWPIFSGGGADTNLIKGKISDSLVFAVQSQLVPARLEFIHTGSNSTTYQNDTLIGTQLLNVSLEGVPISFVPRPSAISMSFNSNTGTITLTNGVFSADDFVLILYRSPPLLMTDGAGKPIRDINGNFIILN